MTIINMYTPNHSAPNFIKQILMDIKGQININMIIVNDHIASLSQIDTLPKNSTKIYQS